MEGQQCLDALEESTSQAVGTKRVKRAALNERFERTFVEIFMRHADYERRKRIEGRDCYHGVIRRSPDSLLKRKYWPEALYHIVHHSEHTITTESPTSFPIEKRIRAQMEAIRAALKLLKL